MPEGTNPDEALLDSWSCRASSWAFLLPARLCASRGQVDTASKGRRRYRERFTQTLCSPRPPGLPPCHQLLFSPSSMCCLLLLDSHSWPSPRLLAFGSLQPPAAPSSPQPWPPCCPHNCGFEVTGMVNTASASRDMVLGGADKLCRSPPHPKLSAKQLITLHGYAYLASHYVWQPRSSQALETKASPIHGGGKVVRSCLLVRRTGPLGRSGFDSFDSPLPLISRLHLGRSLLDTGSQIRGAAADSQTLKDRRSLQGFLFDIFVYRRSFLRHLPTKRGGLSLNVRASSCPCFSLGYHRLTEGHLNGSRSCGSPR